MVRVVSVAVRGDGLIVVCGEKGKVLFTRQGDNLSTDLTVFYKASGAAVNGTDYEQLGGAVVIPAGMASVKLKIKAIPNPANTGPLKVTIKVLAPKDGSYGLGSELKAKLMLMGYG